MLQLEEAFANATESATTLATQMEVMKQSERDINCQLKLVQDDYTKQRLDISKLKNALKVKEVEIKALRQALGCEAPEELTEAGRASFEGQTPAPDTPDERGRRPMWQAADSPLHPAASSTSGSVGKAEADLQKLSQNWDWDDLLGHISQHVSVEEQINQPPFQPPALEPELSYTDQAPREFLCPISLQLITDPVVTPAGVTYDRPSILDWLAMHHSDPASGAPLQPAKLYPNLAVRDLIQKWLVEGPAALSSAPPSPPR